MTPEAALTGLAGIIGPVGIGGVLVALLGWRERAKQGRPEPIVPPSVVSSGPIAGKDIELLANALSQFGASAMRIALIMEFRFVKDGIHQEFEDWSAMREVSILRDQLRRMTEAGKAPHS